MVPATVLPKYAGSATMEQVMDVARLMTECISPADSPTRVGRKTKRFFHFYVSMHSVSVHALSVEKLFGVAAVSHLPLSKHVQPTLS